MVDKNLIERTVNAIKENANGRAVVMYGRHIDIQAALETEGFPIKAVFTGNKEMLADKSLNCTDYREMNGKSDEYYVVIPFFLPDGGKAQHSTLQKFGYNEISDYFFFQKEVILKNIVSYSDTKGNHIECKSNNTTVVLNGKNNRIEIENSNITGTLHLNVIGDNNSIFIEKNNVFGQSNKITVHGNDDIFIEGNSRFVLTSIFAYEDSKIFIGSGGGFEGGFKFFIHPFSDVHIGKEALFSFDVVLQTGDGHSIFDLETGENINSDLNKVNEKNNLSEIYLNEHIWVGREAMILAGLGRTEIGEGSIIGARSFVKGVFPNNCIIAGIPAKVIKKNIAWSRKNRLSDMAGCGKYIKFTEE